MEVRFFDPFGEIRMTANWLPHWQQVGATYFITFRLADAVPANLRAEWENERVTWRARHPLPWSDKTEGEYHQRFSQRMDMWLDASHGECVLRDEVCRRLLVETFEHSEGTQYQMHAWVVMPNHAHVLVTLRHDALLEQEVGAWKSVSSRRINAQLGRHGTLWQEDYFDRLIRDELHFGRCIRYIQGNPAKARLHDGEYSHFERPQGDGAPSPP